MQADSKMIVSFGEILWDLFPEGPELGGAPFNVACRLQGLGDHAVAVSRVGNDDLGKRALAIAREMNLDLTNVQVDPRHPTGTVNVAVDQSGNVDYSIVPDVAFDYIDATDALRQLAATADCFCFGTVIQRAPVSRETLYQLLELRRGKLSLVDINLRKECYSIETVTRSLQAADILKLNLAEAHRLAEFFEISNESLPEFCAELCEEWSLAICLVTLAEYGAVAVARGGTTHYVPGYEVKVVDTCGAGDAFLAGFIHAHLRRQSLAESCRMGNALGALVVGQRGGTRPIAYEQLRRFLAEEPPRKVEGTLKPYRV